MTYFKTLAELVAEAEDDYWRFFQFLCLCAAERREVLNGDLYLENKWERFEKLKAELEKSNVK